MLFWDLLTIEVVKTDPDRLEKIVIIFIIIINFRFNQNFGTIGLLDYIHGTSTVFLENIAHKRHFVLTGLSSAREIVPDEDHNSVQW